MAISPYKARNSRTRIRNSRLRRLPTLYPLTRVMVEVEASQIKFWVSPRRIFVQTMKANEANPPTFLPLAVIPSPSRMTISRVIKI